jgi:hypothetical protein
MRNKKPPAMFSWRRARDLDDGVVDWSEELVGEEASVVVISTSS